jgi:hypothetical protein
MPSGIRTPSVTELFVGDLAAIGNWVVANVRSSVAWPLQVEVVEFRGNRIFLVPRSTTTIVADGSTFTMYPFAAVNLPAGTALREGRRLLSHFLSSLSWVESGGITVEHWSGGSRVHPMGENHMAGLVTSQFELDYLPDPTDQRSRWALAFYREGLSLERSNVAYATLSFFKILNIVADSGRRQKEWINSNISNFGSVNRVKFEIESRLTELKDSGVTDIGEYLYASCRCAVAHAGMNPTVDPENPDDMERLSKDLSLIRAMAAHVIEKALNVKSQHTVWREHLYELVGFKQIFGAELIAQITRGDKPDETNLVDIPTMNVQIQGKAPYGPLTNMNPVRAGYEGGVIHLVLESPDKRGTIGFRLDFPLERLHFEISEDLVYTDDGTPEAAEAVAEVKRFFRDYFGNGRLHIYNADTRSLVSRKDAYLPMNMWLDFKASERDIAYWRKLANYRRQRACSVDNEVLQWSDPYFLSIAVSFSSDSTA